MSGKKELLLNPFFLYQEEMVEIWHTWALRRPAVVSKKWRSQIYREINSRIVSNASRLSILDIPFDYHMYKRINPKALFKRVDPDQLEDSHI